MIIKKRHAISLLIISIFFTACANNRRHAPHSYRPLKVKHKSESYKKGADDGCKTAAETYAKNSNAFRTNADYHKGWWDGRRNCEGFRFAS